MYRNNAVFRRKIFRAFVISATISLIIMGILTTSHSINPVSFLPFLVKSPEPNFSYPMPTALSREQKIQLDLALKKAKMNKKVIVNWFAKGQKKITLKGICGYCEIVSNKSRINDPNTAAVVFLYKDIHAHSMPDPSTRRLDQLYVWETGEAPPALLFLRRRYFQFEDKYGFNATQTYRRDSDIYHPYGDVHMTMVRKGRQFGHDLSLVLEGKTKSAVAVMSNCDSLPGANIRLQFLRDLISDGLECDTFGDCFQFKTYNKRQDEKFHELLKTYKFYIAFENSYHCLDYITEKFFISGLGDGSVPIVWGAAKEDYEAIAPPGSFIYADDFSTTKQLVEYVKYLDRNDTAYLEYFKWYNMPVKEFKGYGQQTRFCQLCRIVHGINVDDIFSPTYNKTNPARPLIDDKMTPRTMPSLYNWYYKSQDQDCLQSASRFYRDNKSLAARTLNDRG